MEERVSGKPYATSIRFEESRLQIYDYSLETFGIFQAERYLEKIKKAIHSLPIWYLLYPECRHIRTKSRIYRNIIVGSHLIIYRVTKERIEVLDIVHSSSSVSKIRGTRQIQI
ncbi:MAG: type II toxin-antitoxin system RelE/ParE family toxin [Lentimicrobiaceae bacterium]|nr:type II toxin-antitoxin system RelE/ParE family toxin [Lentimicrobiaceae bacterium]